MMSASTFHMIININILLWIVTHILCGHNDTLHHHGNALRPRKVLLVVQAIARKVKEVTPKVNDYVLA